MDTEARVHKIDVKTRLLDAALQGVRTKGYSATTIDEVCRLAGVSKGSFFHYFPDKESLALAAAQYFSAHAESFFTSAAFNYEPDPRDRVLAYIDLRAAMVTGAIPDFTCLLGTMVSETYATHPAIREACDERIQRQTDRVAKDLEAAKRMYAPDAPWSAKSMALFTQAVLQGAFILAKASNNPATGVDSIAHLRRYIETQLPLPSQK
jgi:TetR/AcrR family transcriptional repressor of nem operon